MSIRKCKWCGKEFDARGTAAYCPGPHFSTCEVCGKKFEVDVHQPQRACSPECKSMLWRSSFKKKTAICKWCGEEFIPKSPRNFYCDRPHYRTCDICGKSFLITKPQEYYEESRVCSHDCELERARRKCLAEYGVEHHTQRPDLRELFRQKALESLPSRTEKMVSLYGVENPAQRKDVKEKISSTLKSKEYQENFQKTMLDKYGVPYAMKSPELRSKQAKNMKNKSNLELRLHHFLETYKIRYEEEYSIGDSGLEHAFDVYLPDYKILVDCDGVYYHSYIQDPDGGKSREDYDDVRLSLVPKDHYFVLIVESDFERGLKHLQKLIQSIDDSVLDYDSDIFKWCREVGFPYPSYTEKRMKKDYENLCGRWTTSYNPYDLTGISIVRNYHPSVYHCHVSNHVSPFDAWNDDALLKKCIANRLIYQNDVDPSKVLAGFNISKIAPKVSVFNPVLARYLVSKYLNSFSEIFDPFSGFSGRMLGVCSTGKKYVGQDANEISVSESCNIIHDFHLDAEIACKDSMITSGTYECLLTCPPYDSTEIYFEDMILQNCDEWIDTILQNFSCKRYVFVVNKTTKFQDYIVEELPARSHFRSNSEYVVVMNR